MEIINHIATAWAKSLNKPVDEVAALIINADESVNETGINELLQQDANRIKELGKDKFDAGYSKGKKESLTILEKKLAETYGVEHGDIETMINAIIESKNQPNQKAEFSETEWLKHPKTLELQLKIKEKDTMIEQEVIKVKNEFIEKDFQKAVENAALTIITSMNPVLPDDKAIADARLKGALKQMLNFKTKNINGNITIVDEEGVPAKNEHGHPIDFKEVIESNAKIYLDFAKQEPKPTTGASGNNNTNVNLNMPSNKDQYEEMLIKGVTKENLMVLGKFAKSKGWI